MHLCFVSRGRLLVMLAGSDNLARFRIKTATETSSQKQGHQSLTTDLAISSQLFSQLSFPNYANHNRHTIDMP